MGADDDFCFTVLLRMLMGFAQHYKHIIVNQKQEPVLLWAASDIDVLYYNKTTITTAPDYQHQLQKEYWKLPENRPTLKRQCFYIR